jgi:hypothetical protein
MTTDSLAISNDKAESIADDLIEGKSTCKEIIETVISSLAQNDSAMVSHTERGYLWRFEYGSVEVFVQLTGEEDEDLLTVWATVLQLPVKNETGLMQKLLEMNWSGTYEACFGILNGQVVVLLQRTIADIAPGEISRAITLVATLADDNDEALMAAFN